MNKSRTNPLTWIVTALLLSMLLAACDLVGAADPTPTPTPQAEASLSNDAVVSEGNLEPRESRYLSFPASGQVEEILVNSGDLVKKGDVLARLGDTQPAQAALAAADLELQSAQQALDELNRNADLSRAEAWTAKLNADQALLDAQRAWDEYDTDDYDQKIEAEDEKVADAEQELNDAKDNFEPYQDLPEDNTKRRFPSTRWRWSVSETPSSCA